MITNILSDIICSTYEGEVREVRKDAEWKPNRRAMALSFLLFDGRDPEQTLHIVIHGELNYTGVFIAVTDERGRPELDAFECISYHDSCWRTDGIDRTLFANRERMNVIQRSQIFRTRWYDVLDLTDEQLGILKGLRRRG